MQPNAVTNNAAIVEANEERESSVHAILKDFLQKSLSKWNEAYSNESEDSKKPEYAEGPREAKDARDAKVAEDSEEAGEFKEATGSVVSIGLPALKATAGDTSLPCDVRRGAVVALVYFFGEKLSSLDASSVSDALRDYVLKGSHEDRAFMADLMCRHPVPGLKNALLFLLSQGSLLYRPQLFLVFVRLMPKGSPEVSSFLRRHIRYGDQQTKMAAIQAAIEWGPACVREELLLGLRKEASPLVRKAVIEALSLISDEEVRTALARAGR
ncbi:MAG: hypothetical protein WA705_13750 [Candidatus Ozemobacteraceae bacterium]